MLNKLLKFTKVRAGRRRCGPHAKRGVTADRRGAADLHRGAYARRVLLAFVMILLRATTALPADLSVTDRKGRVTDIKDVQLRYVRPPMYDNEYNGLRLLQGDATIVVRWSDIKEIAVRQAVPTRDEEKPDTFVLEGQITLKTGKTTSVKLVQGELIGKVELGEFKVWLDKLQRIVVFADAQK